MLSSRPFAVLVCASLVFAIKRRGPSLADLLATAGTDHDVKIWEELQTTTGTTTATAHGSSSSSSRWTAKAALTEARGGN